MVSQSFSGDILLWQTFWESFESTVHANPALSSIQKFAYLKEQTHNEAARCISGLSLTHANNEQAIILLKDARMQKLINLPSPTLTLNSLRAFYDHIETSFRSSEFL